MSTYLDHLGRSIEIDFAKSFQRVFQETMRKPVPRQVIFNDPYTIVNWEDGTKTIVKCMEGDEFSKDVGFCVAVARKVFGGHGQYKKFIEGAHVIVKKNKCSCGRDADPKDSLNWCGVCAPF